MLDITYTDIENFFNKKKLLYSIQVAITEKIILKTLRRKHIFRRTEFIEIIKKMQKPYCHIP